VLLKPLSKVKAHDYLVFGYRLTSFSFLFLLESLGEGDDDEDNKPKKVIPVNDALSFKDDVENRPDETTMDAYDKIPVEEFGAALLRGLGWNEGDGIGRNRKSAP
jgi:hypothetical protein